MTDAAVKHEQVDPVQTIGGVILLAIAAYIVGNMIAGIVVFALQSIGIPVTGYPERLALVSALSLQGLGFGGMGLAYLAYTDEGFGLIKLHFPDLSGITYLIGGIIAVLLGWAGVTFVITQLGIDPAQNQLIKSGLDNPGLLLLLVPVSILLVGPGEELLYRGIVQEKIKHAIGPVGAIIIASAVFASIHVFGLIGSPTQMVVTLSVIFVLALILGSLYEISGNLLIPAVVHGLFNAIQFLVAYNQAVGGPGLPGII